jgi:hypothetical protein
MMWSRKCGLVGRFVVPEGLMIVARQFIAWDVPNRDPSRRDGMIGSRGRFFDRER